MTLAIRESRVLSSARFGIFLMLVCIQGTHQNVEGDQKDDSGAILAGPLYELSGKLLNQVNRQNLPGNVIMSPVSIHQVLSMVLLGSDDNSRTKQEIQDAIGYSNKSEKDIERCNEGYASIMSEFAKTTKETLIQKKRYEQKEVVAVEDGEVFYARNPYTPIVDLFTMMITKNKAKADPSYERNIKKYFHASLNNIDDTKPETKVDLLKKLNDWAREAGFEGPIMDADYLNDKFEAILLSAIQVEATWSDPFVEHTGKEIFYNDGLKDRPVDGKYLSVKIVRDTRFLEFTQRELAQVGDLHDDMSKDETFIKLANLSFRAIDIPLGGGLKFAIFEPVAANNESSGAKPIAKLGKLVGDLFSTHAGGAQNPDQVTNLARALELLEHSGSILIDLLEIPKFKFESDVDLKPILELIGIRRAFDSRLAEISKITGNMLHVGDVKHKAVIETTEIGIKAASSSMIRMMPVSHYETDTPIEIRVKNPFLFVLHHKKMPLFVGQLTNLKQELRRDESHSLSCPNSNRQLQSHAHNIFNVR